MRLVTILAALGRRWCWWLKIRARKGVWRLVGSLFRLLTLRISTIDKRCAVEHYGCVPLRFFPLTGNEVTDWRERMSEFIRRIWSEDEGQDIAEYAVMLAVILVLVVGTIRLIGSNANNAFSNVASSIQ
jgi:Flp pilus assembly pilin Flp